MIATRRTRTRYNAACTLTILQQIILELRLWRYNLKKAVSGLYSLAGIPPFIREGEYQCSLSGYTVKVTGRGIYTKISIAGGESVADVYFSRLTGKFDGTGYGGSCAGQQCGLPPAKPIDLPEKR